MKEGRGNKVIYETIDGQQRLTTLNILLSVLKNEKEYKHIEPLQCWEAINLSFDSRPISTDTLQLIHSGVQFEHHIYNTAIQQGYEDAKKALRKILAESKGLSIEHFFHYLWNKVVILRVSVPADTDLNHYFEIMNNRGEQLEKHEILKANCLEIIKEDGHLSYTFNLIWEACSNMERYVQYGFSVEQRNQLFGNQHWDSFSFESLDDIADVLAKANSSKSSLSAVSLKDLLNTRTSASKNTETSEDIPERFTTVINFSNFLLHVLRVQTQKDIALDDKRLLELFQPYLKNSDRTVLISFVKQLGYNLLKCKFLFDKYVIKREFLNGGDRWSLKRLKWYNDNKVSYVNTFGDENGNEGENKSILMLLAMFHVSTPTLVYKHWLNAVLKYVYEADTVKASDYKAYLENLAKAFLYDRFLSKAPLDYFEIIYGNSGVSTNKDIIPDLLDQGTFVENFIFNYLDYLLWKRDETKYSAFEYTFRSSVEHYYPQNPMEGNVRINDKYLNSFGNLCLISSSKNSKLSNYMPTAKKEHYLNSTSIDSVKQRMMMDEKEWGIKEIEEHSKKMRQVLMEEINH